MYAAIGDEPEQVESPRTGLGRVDGAAQCRVSAERPLSHRCVDARHIHERDAPGTEIEVPDLAIAHLTRR
jgi:hypothetical protein